MVLLDFAVPLNIVSESQYAENVVLYVETAEFISDDSELTSQFIQLEEIVINRYYIYTGLLDPLA